MSKAPPVPHVHPKTGTLLRGGHYYDSSVPAGTNRYVPGDAIDPDITWNLCLKITEIDKDYNGTVEVTLTDIEYSEAEWPMNWTEFKKLIQMAVIDKGIVEGTWRPKRIYGRWTLEYLGPQEKQDE